MQSARSKNIRSKLTRCNLKQYKVEVARIDWRVLRVAHLKDVLFVPNVTISPSFRGASLPGKVFTGFAPGFLLTNVPNFERSCTRNGIRGI